MQNHFSARPVGWCFVLEAAETASAGTAACSILLAAANVALRRAAGALIDGAMAQSLYARGLAAAGIFAVSPAAGVFLLATGAPMLAAFVFIGSRQRAVSGKKQKTAAGVMLVFNELLSNRLSIKLARLTDGFERRMLRALAPFDGANLADARLQSAQGGAMALAGVLQYAGVVVFGIFMMNRGAMELGGLVFVSQLAPLVMQMFTSLGGSVVSLQGAMAGITRVAEVLSLPGEDMSARGARPDLAAPNALETHEMSVEFANGARAHISHPLSAPRGQITAILGASGSGKSTLCRVALGLYGYGGSALLFGSEIREYGLPALRGAVSYAAQDCYIAKASVRDNLTLARGAHTDAHIDAAMRAARCDEWVYALPKGLDSMLSERGGTLSGGQRQSLALARAAGRQAVFVARRGVFKY